MILGVRERDFNKEIISSRDFSQNGHVLTWRNLNRRAIIRRVHYHTTRLNNLIRLGIDLIVSVIDGNISQMFIDRSIIPVHINNYLNTKHLNAHNVMRINNDNA